MEVKEVSMVGFFDQFVESNMKPVEKIVFFAEILELTKEVSNLVETGKEFFFHDHLFVFDIKST